jgi:hypothetical protein
VFSGCGKAALRFSDSADYLRSAAFETVSDLNRRRKIMTSKRLNYFAAVAFAVIAAVVAGSASAAPTRGAATVSIRHQMRGCHTWSLNGGSHRASLAVRVERGEDLAIVNNDVMPHKLVQMSGPSVKLIRPAMNHMSAKAQVRFSRAGVYHFKTKAGEDYPWAGKMKTIGEDNILRLTVTVR